MSARLTTLTAVRVPRVLTGAVCACLVAVCLLSSAAALAATAPVVVEESASNIASSSATLAGQVNPEGTETTYWFEYGTSEAYGASAPVPDGSAGAGTSAAPVQAHTQALQPQTTYHFRLVAANAGGTVDGADRTFTTQAGGGALALPDGRQWEMVSPPLKNGGRILPIQEGGGAVQAAEDGGAFTYLTTTPVEANPAGNANETQLLATRGAEGWSTQNLQPAHSEAINASVGEGEEYRVFSPDLSEAIVQPFTGKGGEALLSPEASEYTIYLHDNADGAGSGYLPLVSAADVAPGVRFGGEENGAGRVDFIAATPDLSHVVLQAQAALTSTPNENGLYEWAAGHLQVVNLLPGRDVAAKCASVGNDSGNVRGALSSDGSRVVWYVGSGSSCEDEEEIKLFGSYTSHLYLRDMAKEETIRLDAVQGGSGAGEADPVFQLATSDGSRVFFTDSEQLTPGATASGPDLYECEVIEVAGKPTCKLTDLTVDGNVGGAADVVAVLGASEDGSYVYLLAGGALAPGAAPVECSYSGSSGCNLYVRHDGGTTFIAALSQDDAEWGSLENGNLRQMTERVSPDGRYLEFMSDRSLTGYDNRDANSGAPDEEVYLYDAESGRLVCASCNPTGARPVGIEIDPKHEPLAANERIWGTGRWLAANVPSWTGLSLSSSRYQSRYLSNSGRLFFNSSDALVPQDTNGTEDVYEYEPAGIGSCVSSSSTFSEKSGGCVGLISSGAGSEESAFMDASVNGDDVFFITSAQLAPADIDDAYDVYDAHVCSTAAPCPTAIESPPPCTTADSCRTAPAPQPGIFGAPASATFSGSGNPAPAQPAAKAKTKKRAKTKKKTKAERKGKTGKKGKKGRRTQGKTGKQTRAENRARRLAKRGGLSTRTRR
jgi:hypothetical protein